MNIKHRIDLSQHGTYIIYGLLALVVLGTLLLPGYILALDMVWVPDMPAPESVTNTYLFQQLIHFLSYLIPSQLLQKLLLFMTLVLASWGIHRLISYKLPEREQWIAFVGGTFYAINPFTYARFMSGQYLVLLGYALLPWLALSLAKFLAKPEASSALKLFLWILAISLVSLHIFGMAVLVVVLGLILSIFKSFKNKNYKHLKPIGMYIGLVLIGFLIVSSYWLIPTLKGTNSTIDQLQTFDGRHLVSFRTDGGSLGVPINVLSLNGFWADREAIYLSPNQATPVQTFLFVMLFVLVIAGAILVFKKQRLLTAILLGCLIIGWLLAQGIVNTPLAGINRWLFEYLPFFNGYREPGKFIALIALAEAYFLSHGVLFVIDRLKRSRKQLNSWLLGLMFALPLIYTPTMLWGFAGQLKATDYPEDWYQTKQYFVENPGKALFLPWHMYLHFGFADRVIANPARAFFGPAIIQGDNPEIGLIPSDSTRPDSVFIEQKILSERENLTDVGQKLNQRGIRYILLAKDADWREYTFLDKQTDLQLISEGPSLKMYRNMSVGVDN